LFVLRKEKRKKNRKSKTGRKARHNLLWQSKPKSKHFFLLFTAGLILFERSAFYCIKRLFLTWQTLDLKHVLNSTSSTKISVKKEFKEQWSEIWGWYWNRIYTTLSRVVDIDLKKIRYMDKDLHSKLDLTVDLLYHCL